jgi:hypothetical protein
MGDMMHSELKFLKKNIGFFFVISIVIAYFTYDSGISFFFKVTYQQAPNIVNHILDVSQEWIRRSYFFTDMAVLVSVVIIYSLLSKHADAHDLLYIIPNKARNTIIARVLTIFAIVLLFDIAGVMLGNYILAVQYKIMQINYVGILGYGLIEEGIRILLYVAMFVFIYYLVSWLSEEHKFAIYYPVSIFAWFMINIFGRYIFQLYSPLTISDAFLNPANWMKLGVNALYILIFVGLTIVIYDGLRFGHNLSINAKNSNNKDAGTKSRFWYEFYAIYDFKSVSFVLIPLAFILVIWIGGIARHQSMHNTVKLLFIWSEFLFPLLFLPVMKNITSIEKKLQVQDLIEIIPGARNQQVSTRIKVFVVISILVIGLYILLNTLIFRLTGTETVMLLLELTTGFVIVALIAAILMQITKNDTISIVITVISWILLFTLRRQLPDMVNPFACYSHGMYSPNFWFSKTSLLFLSAVAGSVFWLVTKLTNVHSNTCNKL